MAFTETDLKRQLVLLNEIENQTDRGTVIVAAAWLDEELKSALQGKCIKDEKALKNMFEGSSPLGAFSSKIELAYLLGITTRNQYLDLHIIRKIRNEFAHKLMSKEIEALEFSTPNIMDRCMSISCIQKEKPLTPRQAFCRACSILYSDLYLSSFVQ